MEFKKQRIEILVGLFLVMGLAILGVLIVMFGKFGDRFEDTYPLEVSFIDATGVVKGSHVQLGGAKVGHVFNTPELSENYDKIIVGLNIYADTQIPEGSVFSISKSGLLGDSYISIQPPKERNGSYLAEGTSLVGKSGGGLEGLEQTVTEVAGKAGETLDVMKVAILHINKTVANVDKLVLETKKVLEEENLEKIKKTLVNLEEMSTKLNLAADKFEPMLDEAQSTLAKTGATIENAGQVFDEIKVVIKEDIKPALSGIDPALTDLRKTANAATFTINSVSQGQGLLPSLIHDPELKDDFSDLVGNLKNHGVIFYRDSSRKVEASRVQKRPRPSPRRRR